MINSADKRFMELEERNGKQQKTPIGETNNQLTEIGHEL
jgi:uncharacterized coiled-coil protein SlyX